MVSYSSDVAVIGAGVIGSSIALELARGGRNVVVLDKAGGIGHGSTAASSGIVRFHYSTLTGVSVAWEAAHAWREWAAHLGGADPAGLATYCRTGMLVLEPAAGASHRTTTLFDRVGVPWEAWDSSDIARHLAHVDPGRYGPPAPVASDAFFAEARGTLSGTFTPDAGHVEDPQLAAQNLGVAGQRYGVRYLLRHAVIGIAMGGPRRWQLTTAVGATVQADVIVNAAGPWSGAVNALAGAGAEFTVTSRPLRQEVHHVPAPPGYGGVDSAGAAPGIAIADPDLGIYIRPTRNGDLLIGGMEPECDPLEWVNDPDAANPRVTGPIFEAQVMRAARRLPGLAVPNRRLGVAGVYDASTDWTPVYDRTDLPGYYVAMGTSGNQFKNAPVVGLLMRTLVDAVEAGHDHDREPVQVRLPRTGGTADLACYSRLREVGAGAPASVMG